MTSLGGIKVSASCQCLGSFVSCPLRSERGHENAGPRIVLKEQAVRKIINPDHVYDICMVACIKYNELIHKHIKVYPKLGARPMQSYM